MRNWKMVQTDDEFLALFTGHSIVQTATVAPDDCAAVDADIFWNLSNGTWIAMHLATGYGGCSTCGYGSDEKVYYVTVP